MGATVYTTAGGRRFHADDSCPALWSAQALSDWDYDYEFPPPAGARLPQQHAIEAQQPLDAARVGYTACRVCVPPALALPATGETFGHEPVRDPIAGAHGWPQFPVCARCSWGQVYYAGSLRKEPVHVAWPCTSAVVLGLVPRGGA